MIMENFLKESETKQVKDIYEQFLQQSFTVVHAEYWQKIESKIRDLLKEKGYEFKSKEEFYSFSKDHLELERVRFPDMRKAGSRIYIDGKYLCEWIDEWEMAVDPATFSITATLKTS